LQVNKNLANWCVNKIRKKAQGKTVLNQVFLQPRYAVLTMKKITLIFLLFTSIYASASEGMSVIDGLLVKDNYSNELWLDRGLNPSSKSVVMALESATSNFLKSLKVVASIPDLDQATKIKEVTLLVDSLPWDDLDTEEKEFMADTLAPAIESLGLNPWLIF
jgi:hypothetical protein